MYNAISSNNIPLFKSASESIVVSNKL